MLIVYVVCTTSIYMSDEKYVHEFIHLKRMPSLCTRSTFYSTAVPVSADNIQKYIERQSKA